MTHPFSKACALALVVLLAAGCDRAPAAPAQPTAALSAAPLKPLGLMTSLPLYWPLDAAIGDITAGRADLPWQRRAIDKAFLIEPLDTLSPIPALSPGAPVTDPLAGMERLAVIQPRGLSPADNLALDTWLRGGGRLLLVLDPMLTGDYDLPLGDPRRPVDSAVIPPVVARWGLAVRFDETQSAQVVKADMDGAVLPLALAGTIAITDPASARCTLAAGGAAARCQVGKGEVTVIADAAVFEHADLAGDGGRVLQQVLQKALG